MLFTFFPDTTEEVLIDVDEVLPRGSGQGEDYTPVRLDQNVVGSEVIDVTVPVQCQVDAGSRLTFYEDSATKSELAGFYDPCALLADESKHLLVRQVVFVFLVVYYPVRKASFHQYSNVIVITFGLIHKTPL